jgi:hypothetical protein
MLHPGRSNYHMHSRDASTLLLELFWRIKEEIGTMPTALEEFARDSREPAGYRELECRVMMAGHFPLGAKGLTLSHAHFSGGIEE